MEGLRFLPRDKHMAPLVIFFLGFLAACEQGRGGGASSGPVLAEAPPAEDDALRDEAPEEPMPPPDPTGPPAESTLKAIKYVLAPCASPLVFDLPARVKVGVDLMLVNAVAGKKTLTLNGVDLWETSADDRTAFAFDLNVKALGTEALYASYACNSIVTSYPDDANPDNQRGAVDIDASSATATVSWHTRREQDKDLAYKIEVALPGGGGVVVFEGQ